MATGAASKIAFGCALCATFAGCVTAAVPVPRHVKNFLSYAMEDINQNVPADFMAAHADYIEARMDHQRYIAAFKKAGGKFAVVKLDTTHVGGCKPPFMPPDAGTCGGPFGDMPEEAWLHDATGARIHEESHGTSYEMPNPGSAVTQKAVHDYTAMLAGQGADMFFLHNAGGMDFRDSAFQPAVEITSQEALDAAEAALMSAVARPVFWTALFGTDSNKAQLTQLTRSPNVMGAMTQDCYVKPGEDRFVTKSNSILQTFARARAYLCTAAPPTLTPEQRVYIYAAWLLTYHPVHSIIGVWYSLPPTDPQGKRVGVDAVHDIVPRQPVQTATSDVRTLLQEGIYVREWTSCFQAGDPIGGCAVFVNPSPRAVPLPAVATTYRRSLVLSGGNSWNGNGTATWAPGVPTALGPVSGAILLK